MYGAKVVTVPAAVGGSSAVVLANTGASIGWMLFGGAALLISGLALRVAVLRRPVKQARR
jgi:hypothetical protein